MCAECTGWSEIVKVFLSYGHDRNAPLVDRIGRDLEAAGHEVWIDKSEIKAGEHWRRSIVDGLQDTDWVLAVLSRHSVRDPGVCLDEIGIALHAKGGAIATVLVENDAKVDPPVSVSHIQWLDMRDWAERQAKGGPEWENWYNNKRGEILALLASPDVQRFAGEIKELDGLLAPVSQQGDIGALVDGFVGRAWLQRQVDEWRQTAKDSRLLWISGSAGTGKSAFAAWLGHHGKVNVIALNLCAYNSEDRRDASRVIRTLAFQIATRLPDYRRLMLNRLKTRDREGEPLGRRSPAALFSFLLVEPLRLCIDGGRRGDRYLVVIDGLDETIRDGRSDLAEVISADAQNLPPWMAIIVTSRPEEPIQRQFAGLKPVWLKADSPENMADIESYLRGWLPSWPEIGADLESYVARIAAASEWNFLYVSKLREAVAAETLSLRAPEGLPQGLVGLYERWFRHRFPSLETYERYSPLLSVIVAAEHPVPEAWLTRLFGWSKRKAAGAQLPPSAFATSSPSSTASFTCGAVASRRASQVVASPTHRRRASGGASADGCAFRASIVLSAAAAASSRRPSLTLCRRSMTAARAPNARSGVMWIVAPCASRPANVVPESLGSPDDLFKTARYMAIVARHIAPKAPPKAELPPGVALPDLTMDHFMDIEDHPTRGPRRLDVEALGLERVQHEGPALSCPRRRRGERAACTAFKGRLRLG